MGIMQKRLTRIQLVNWHYFENETISLNGTTLISGENTAGTVNLRITDRCSVKRSRPRG